MTDPDRADAELAAWKRRYELFATASRMVLYDFCTADGSVSRSASVEDVLGVPVGDIGTTLARWVELIHQDDRPSVAAALEKAERTVRPLDVQYRILHADGRYLEVHDRGYPSIDEATGHLHFIGVVEDVTDTKRKDDLRLLLARTMESVSEIATITDLEDRLTFVNDSFLRTYGYTRGEVIGRRIGFVWSPNNPPGVLDDILGTSRTGSWRGEVLNVRKDGSEFPISLRTSQVRDEKGRVIGLLGISEDITDRRRLEAQLLQAQKMEAVGRLAGGIAHDFNNATAVVLGFAELLRDRLSPHDPMCSDVDAIIHAAQKSAGLTRQLLAFARKQEVAPVVVNLNETLAGMKAMLGRLIGEDVHLDYVLSDGLWNIRIDPTQLEQVLANLATNARDAIENVGTITIRTANVTLEAGAQRPGLPPGPGRYVELLFTDTGKGMDSATQEQIFDPFFTTKAVGKGTGLGLSTVFGIVHQNGGTISVESQPGAGTTFSILWPRAEADVKPAAEGTATQARRGTETVLVVEDEYQLLDLARLALAKVGYQVLTARSCGDALLLCEQHEGPIHVLLTDVVMPGMNGRQLRDRIAELRPGIRTVFMSGYTADVLLSRGVDEKGNLFLQKPFTPTELAAKIARVLGG